MGVNELDKSIIIPNISFLKESKLATNCLHYSLMVILQSWNIPIDKVVGGSWGVYYRKLGEDHNIKPLLGFISNYDYQNISLWGGLLTPGLGYSLNYTRQVDSQAALNELKSKMSDGVPMIVLVDSYYLRWRKQYKFRHQAHWFVAYGYGEDFIYVLDGWEQEFLGTLKCADLIAAWSHCKQPGESYEPLFPDKLNNEAIEIVKKQETSDQIFDFGLFENIINNYFDDNTDGIVYHGKRGILEFASDLQHMPECFNESNLKKLMSKYFELIFSFTNQRNIFIKSITPYLYSEGEIGNSILSKLKNLLTQWMVIRNLFYKASVHDTCTLCSSISERLRILADTEKKAMEEMLLIISKDKIT